MSEAENDVARALLAGRAIIDGRDFETDCPAILVSLEHAVAAVLIAVVGDPRKAAAMLNEGLVPGVERRLLIYAERQP